MTLDVIRRIETQTEKHFEKTLLHDINVQVCFWNLGGLFEFQAAFFTVAPKQP
jgi:hypothetical protein